MKPIDPFRPPWVSADDLNALAAEVLRLSKLSVEGGDLDQSPGGPLIRIPATEKPIPTKITEVGDATDEGTTPYGWVQQRPAVDGTWEDDPNGLKGFADGTGAGPAFADDGAELAVDDIVWLRRGYVGIVDGEVRQEWVSEGGAGSGSFTDLRVTGRPWTQDGHRCYPAARDVPDPASPIDYHDGAPPPLWVFQRTEAPLGTTGDFYVRARRRNGSFRVEGGDGPETRALYRTDDRIVLADISCSGTTITGVYTGTFEGEADANGLTVGGEFLTVGGERLLME